MSPDPGWGLGTRLHRGRSRVYTWHGSLFSVHVGLPYGWQQFQDDDSNQVFVE